MNPLGSCDASAAGVERAVVTMKKGNDLELILCTHHYNKHCFTLHLSGWEITEDIRERETKDAATTASR